MRRIVLVGAICLWALPVSAQGEGTSLQELGSIWFTSGVSGHFADPICERGHALEPSEFAGYAEAIRAGVSESETGLLLDTGGLLAPNGIARFAARTEPDSLVALVRDIGYRALAFGEADLGVGWELLLPVYRALREAGIPTVASNLRCMASAQPLCDVLVDPEDGVAMLEFGENRVAFLALMSPGALERVAPSAAAGLSLAPTAVALARSVRAARARGATVVVASLDQGWGDDVSARVMDVVAELEDIEKPDLVFAAGAGERLVFARPMDFRPAVVAASPGRATQVMVRQDLLRGYLDVLARPVEPTPWPSSVITRWARAVGTGYCDEWGRALPGANLSREIDHEGMLGLAASIVRDESRSEVVFINRAITDRTWSPSHADRLTESDVYLSLTYDEPLVTAMVEGRWLDQVARAYDETLLLALGLTVTRTATTTTVKINGRPIELRGRYRVTTLRFLATGGDGLLPPGPEWEPWEGERLRTLVLRTLRQPGDDDPRDRALPDLSIPVWSLQLDTDFSFSASAVTNPGGYADSQLQAATSSTFGLDSTVRFDLLQRLWAWDNQVQVRYRTTSSGGTGFEESQDLTSLRTSGRWRGLRNISAEWYVPDPYFEGYLETELTVPEDNDFRHFLVRPTLGVQFALTRHLNLKLNVGMEAEVFDPEAQLGPGLGARLELKPWIIMREGTRRLDLSFALDYFAADVGGRDRQTLRGQMATQLAFNRFVSLGLNFDLYGAREGGGRVSAAVNTTAFLRLSWLQRFVDL